MGPGHSRPVLPLNMMRWRPTPCTQSAPARRVRAALAAVGLRRLEQVSRGAADVHRAEERQRQGAHQPRGDGAPQVPDPLPARLPLQARRAERREGVAERAPAELPRRAAATMRR